MIPCSAATVIGIVCDAAVASRPELRSCARYSALNEPEPQPSSGFSRARSTPPSIRSKRPDVASFERVGVVDVELQRAPEREHDHGADHDRAAAPARRRPCRRSAATPAPAGPSSSAAKLDCESVVISPPHSTTSAAIVQRQRARPLRPQQHARQPDHHQREEAPVDVRVEEQRVDPEVLLDLVGGDHLRVQQQVARLELPEADRGEDERQRHERAAAPGQPPRRPLQPAQEREQQRERHVEEHDLLERLRAVLGVDGLHARRARSRPSAPTRARPRARRASPAWRARQPRDQPRQRAGADHDVQRHEQVRGAPARLHRDAERQRGQREPRRAPRAGARTATPARPSRPAPTAAATSASAPRSRTDSSCGESQISATSSTGVSTSAPSIAHARPRTVRPSTAPAASAAATHHAGDQHPRPGRPRCRSSARSGSSAARRAGCRRCCG